jgi:hypothetical protein
LLRGRAAIEGYYREWFKGPAKVTGFTFTHLESLDDPASWADIELDRDEAPTD